MRTFLEYTYVGASIVPTALLGMVILQTEPSSVSGIVIGSAIPLLALISLILVLIGSALSVFAYQHGRRVWHLVLGTALSSSLALMMGLNWLL